jgi:hypothetical protein
MPTANSFLRMASSSSKRRPAKDIRPEFRVRAQHAAPLLNFNGRRTSTSGICDAKYFICRGSCGQLPDTSNLRGLVVAQFFRNFRYGKAVSNLEEIDYWPMDLARGIIMKSKLLLVSVNFIALIAIIGMAHAAGTEKSSLEVTVDRDSIILSISGDQGQNKSVSLFKDRVINNPNGNGITIENELYIGDDKIVIDGVEFTTEDIDDMLISREGNESGMTLRAKLPDTYRDSETPRKVIKIDRTTGKDRVSFSGLTVTEGEVVEGDAVALTGDVKVFGRVHGDIISVLGSVFMYDGSFADGDVVAPFGKVITEGKYKIRGKLTSKDEEYKRHTANVDLSARFNRVEGFTPLMNISVRDSKHELPKVDFNIGYGFALKRWNLDFGFKQNIGINGPFYFGGNIYQGAFTPDKWYFSETDNTGAGLFFKEDYHDFYKRKGGRLLVGREFWKNGFAQAEYTAQANSPLTRHTNKAIFGGHKNFRGNYSTVYGDSAALAGLKGDLRMLGLHLGWDSRDKDIDGVPSYHRGQYFDLTLEMAGDGSLGDIGGDFSYDIAEMTFQHYQPVTPRQFVGFRLRGGLSNQILPLDRRFFLGGVGSLRGYDFKEFEGNRYFLTNIDYYWEFSDDFVMALFTDLGQSGFSKTQFEKNGLKSDVGVGLLLFDAFRLDIAQRLDDTGEKPVMTARIETTF